ncbi:MAG: hypothetical protein ACK5OH_00585 [bacterium]
MTKKYFYIDDCPICSQGLARVRVHVRKQSLTGYILCDECEAAWNDPSLLGRIPRGKEGDASCPDGKTSVWSEHCHWASIEEICLLGWYNDIKAPKDTKMGKSS